MKWIMWIHTVLSVKVKALKLMNVCLLNMKWNHYKTCPVYMKWQFLWNPVIFLMKIKGFICQQRGWQVLKKDNVTVLYCCLQLHQRQRKGTLLHWRCLIFAHSGLLTGKKTTENHLKIFYSQNLDGFTTFCSAKKELCVLPQIQM